MTKLMHNYVLCAHHQEVELYWYRIWYSILCKWPSGVQVEEHSGRSFTENTVADAVLIQSDLLMMSTELLETCGGL